MIKKILFIILVMFITGAFNEAYAEVKIDDANSGNGVVGVSYSSNSGKKIKVMIQKDSTKYTYNLKPDGAVEKFPLQMGDGKYKVSVLENTSGTKYSYLDTKTIDVELKNPNVVFLNSIQNIKWDNNLNSIKKGKELSGEQKEHDKKLSTLYSYIIKNVTYDYDKIPYLTTDYNPNIEQTYRDKKGICYDYSSLLAGMQRSQGLPTKLVKGYAKGVDGYHAWNEVLIGGKWVVVDSTFDAAMWGGKISQKMIKSANDYTKVNEY